jgi:hypothetical protein
MTIFTKNILFTFSILLSVLFFSCSKTPTKVLPDISYPKLSITYPLKNSTLKSEAPINIVGTATDNNLARLEVVVYNVTDTGIIYKRVSDIKGSGFTINQSYTKYFPDALPNKKCLLVVKVLDGANNPAVDSIKFSVIN